MDLREFFNIHNKVAVAFSGGTDSAYLLYMAQAYGADTTAIYIFTPFQPAFELEDAKRFCKTYGIPLTVLTCDILNESAVTANPADRCYHCKRVLFIQIKETARKMGYYCVIDGTNASDDAGDRPGMKALEELGILSPLRLCGITKDTLRKESRRLGLFTADKPAYACLATRIPTGTPINASDLKRIENAESALFKLGFTDFRVRLISVDTAKLEIQKDQLALVLSKRTEILQLLSPFFDKIYLDLNVR